MKTIFVYLFLLLCFSVIAQNNLPDSIPYSFSIVKSLKTTPAKQQGNTGTCWCYATCSFIETEALRMGKAEFDLSEMYIVKKVYAEKADNFIRLQGKVNFGEGGQAHDAISAIAKVGIVPESVFSGKKPEEEYHNHENFNALLKAMLDNFIASDKKNTLVSNWSQYYASVQDIFFGADVSEFVFSEKKISPLAFSREVLGINPDDYIEFTSYSNYPYYKTAVLQIPDNWSHGSYYNVPLDDFIAIMNNSLNTDYSFVWDGDVTEKGFFHKKGIAIVPEKKYSDKNRDEMLNAIEPEKKITEEIRQKAFDNFSCTDDHLMHITGIAKDQNGKTYYITKNSWGETSNSLKGFLYMSESYVRLNTIAILVHKKAVPAGIAKKLGL